MLRCVLPRGASPECSRVVGALTALVGGWVLHGGSGRLQVSVAVRVGVGAVQGMFWGVCTEGCTGPVEGWRSALDCCVVKKVEGCAGVCLTITCLYVYSNTELSHL